VTCRFVSPLSDTVWVLFVVVSFLILDFLVVQYFTIDFIHILFYQLKSCDKFNKMAETNWTLDFICQHWKYDIIHVLTCDMLTVTEQTETETSLSENCCLHSATLNRTRVTVWNWQRFTVTVIYTNYSSRRCDRCMAELAIWRYVLWNGLLLNGNDRHDL